jgi:UDP-N-acetylmuramate dehydrogenase
MNTSPYTLLHTQFPELPWQSEFPLAPATYMKIGGPAEVAWEAHDLDQLVDVLRFCRDRQIPVTVLGGSSNVLIADEGVRGLVILNRCDQMKVLPAAVARESLPVPLHGVVTDDRSYLQVESGQKTALLVGYSVQQGLSGLEPFLGVPGTVGGAIFNNSHYTQELIGTFVAAVEVLDTQGNRLWLSQSECDFGYDTSRFHQSGETILQVLFGLTVGEAAQSQQLIAEATRKRATTQPLGTANSGCMFRNVEVPPEKQDEYDGQTHLSAGWLIDQAGLKGLQVGGAVVSDKHANFIVNTGTATASDVKQLVQKIQSTIQEKNGVTLVPEVFFLGFSPDESKA